MTGRYQWNQTVMGTLSNDPTDEYYVGSDNAYKPGQVMPTFNHYRITNGDSMGVLPIFSDTRESYGPSYPPHEASAGLTLNLWNRLTLDTFFLGQFGHVITDRQASYMVQNGVTWPACVATDNQKEAYDAGEGTLEGLSAQEIARCSNDYGWRRDWAASGDFVRMGTVSASYRLQEEWLAKIPIGFDQATLQFQAQNLWHWTNFPGMHPSALMGSAASVDRVAGGILPPPKRFTLNLRLNF
jgi:hypothetical protein